MRKALVVGAGVGGLTAAVGLLRTGWEVEVLERAPEPRSILVGGGLHVWPNGMRALRHLDLAERVESVGRRIGRLDWHAPRGGRLATADLRATARALGAPSVGVRRADLLGALLGAVGDERLRFGAEVAAVRQDRSGVDVVLADGSETRAGVLVAADGLQSTVRGVLGRDTDRIRPGVLVFQGIAEDVEALRGVFWEVWGDGVRLGSYPVRDGAFWFAFLRSAESAAVGAKGARELLLERTVGWEAPGLGVLAATPAAAVVWAEVVACRPLPSWAERRIALLGDAAHAMTPFTGQGACQAIEDAVVLAECLRAQRDPVVALRRYGAARGPRVAQIWNRSSAAATSFARRSRPLDASRRVAFARTFERVVWKQLEATIAQPLELGAGLG